MAIADAIKAKAGKKAVKSPDSPALEAGNEEDQLINEENIVEHMMEVKNKTLPGIREEVDALGTGFILTVEELKKLNPARIAAIEDAVNKLAIVVNHLAGKMGLTAPPAAPATPPVAPQPPATV
jgi:hypothetical protein